MTAQVRFDKIGRRLPDTGHGCGCSLCENTGAARYERRSDSGRNGSRWSGVRRALFRSWRAGLGRPLVG